MFNPNFVPALESQPNMYEDLEAVTTPLLYVGIHNHQLYVQESAHIADFTTSDQSNQEISGNPSTSSRFKNLKSHKNLIKFTVFLWNSALTPFRVRWQPLTAKTSLVGYQGRPGRFTTSTAVSTEDKDEASTKEHIEENNDPKITAMIVRHQTDYPYGKLNYYRLEPFVMCFFFNEQIEDFIYLRRTSHRRRPKDQLVKIKMLPTLKKKKKSYGRVVGIPQFI